MMVEFGNDRRNVKLSLSICTLSVADPDPGSGAFLTPASGMGKRSGSGSGMKNWDHISECLETISLGLKYLNSLRRIRDQGWKKFGSRIRNIVYTTLFIRCCWDFYDGILQAGSRPPQVGATTPPPPTRPPQQTSSRTGRSATAHSAWCGRSQTPGTANGWPWKSCQMFSRASSAPKGMGRTIIKLTIFFSTQMFYRRRYYMS